MLTYTFLAALALLGPFALFKWFARETVIERVQATIACISLLGSSRYAPDNDLFNAYLPDGRIMMLDVDKDRVNRLKSTPFVNANVTISRPAFGAPYISSVQWPGEVLASPSANKNGGLYLGVAYMLLGWAATAYTLQPDVYADLGRLGTAFAGLLIALSGYVIATVHMKPLPADARVDMLGGLIKLGSGRQSVILATIIACALTAACYFYGGIGLFFGLNIGCAAGMLVGLLCNKPAPQATVLR
ncbi:MAG: hypothetical protein P4L53_08750 [Candidatus Obscuribacterales bacterium]|nr:hypothetical protein [Candidatus Obscuribacterales bacterium]